MVSVGLSSSYASALGTEKHAQNSFSGHKMGFITSVPQECALILGESWRKSVASYPASKHGEKPYFRIAING